MPIPRILFCLTGLWALCIAQAAGCAHQEATGNSPVETLAKAQQPLSPTMEEDIVALRGKLYDALPLVERIVPSLVKKEKTFVFSEPRFVVNWSRPHPLDKVTNNPDGSKEIAFIAEKTGVIELGTGDSVRLTASIIRAYSENWGDDIEPWDHKFEKKPRCLAFVLLALSERKWTDEYGHYSTSLAFAREVLGNPEKYGQDEYLLLAAMKFIGLNGRTSDLPLLEPYFKRTKDLRIFSMAWWAEAKIKN